MKKTVTAKFTIEHNAYEDSLKLFIMSQILYAGLNGFVKCHPSGKKVKVVLEGKKSEIEEFYRNLKKKLKVADLPSQKMAKELAAVLKG